VVSTLEIDSKDFGKITVNTKQRVMFPDGLYGFENFKEYYILEYDEIFKCLQSKDDKHTAFIVINPYYFKKDYVLDIDESDYREIGLENEQEIRKYLDLYVIVTIPAVDPNNMTANLLGPIIINSKTQTGKQSLSRNSDYSVKHNILEELKQNSSNEEN
jgi:flagellar assembly factor FliW